MDHRDWMLKALVEAQQAANAGEVPVGALIVRAGVLLASERNRREERQDPTAHAEVLALRAAAGRLGHWRLSGATLYVTLEPCAMCAGALILARIDCLVFGAYDPKAGAVASLFQLANDPRLNHRMAVVGGVEQTASAELLRQFFQRRRG